MRAVDWNWTCSRTRDLRASGSMLLISFEDSDCGVVTIRLPFSSTGVERTSLSFASKKVNPVWPVDSQVNFFYEKSACALQKASRCFKHKPARKSRACFTLARLDHLTSLHGIAPIEKLLIVHKDLTSLVDDPYLFPSFSVPFSSCL